jgi:hypothetical protein
MYTVSLFMNIRGQIIIFWCTYNMFKISQWWICYWLFRGGARLCLTLFIVTCPMRWQFLLPSYHLSTVNIRFPFPFFFIYPLLQILSPNTSSIIPCALSYKYFSSVSRWVSWWWSYVAAWVLSGLRSVKVALPCWSWF